MQEFEPSFNRNQLYETERDGKTGALVPKLNEQGLYQKNAALLKFESKIGMTIRQIPFGYFAEHFLKQDGTIDPQLIQQKVLDLVIQGAEFIPIYDRLATIVDMTAPKQELPVSAYTGFTVVKGSQGSGTKQAGGYTDVIELDCSNGKGMYRVDVAFEKYWIRQAQWSAVENALRDAGQVMYDAVAGAILDKLVADVDSTMTNTLANWGNGAYKSLMKSFGLLASAQIRPTAAIINPSSIVTLGAEDYFINSLYVTAGKMDLEPESGLFGYLMPMKVPIYYHYKQTAHDMTMLSVRKSAAMGIFQPLTVESFNDVWNGKEGGVLTMQFDVKDGKNANKSKPTAKAWALVTATES